jgi:hypothetical protein
MSFLALASDDASRQRDRRAMRGRRDAHTRRQLKPANQALMLRHTFVSVPSKFQSTNREQAFVADGTSSGVIEAIPGDAQLDDHQMGQLSSFSLLSKAYRRSICITEGCVSGYATKQKIRGRLQTFSGASLNSGWPRRLPPDREPSVGERVSSFRYADAQTASVR